MRAELHDALELRGELLAQRTLLRAHARQLALKAAQLRVAAPPHVLEALIGVLARIPEPGGLGVRRVPLLLERGLRRLQARRELPRLLIRCSARRSRLVEVALVSGALFVPCELEGVGLPVDLGREVLDHCLELRLLTRQHVDRVCLQPCSSAAKVRRAG